MSPKLREKLAQYRQTYSVFDQIFEHVRARFEAAPHLSAHNFEHAYRDTLNAIAIGEAEGADMHIVLPAIVMHDIGFLYGGGHAHGAVGAEKLAEFLAEVSIKLPDADLAHIAACLRTHKGSMHGEEPATPEAKVVSDADLLDKFGPVGIYQALRSFTEANLDAAEVVRRFTAVVELTFQTKTGEALAAPHREYAEKFGRELQQAYAPYQLPKEGAE